MSWSESLREAIAAWLGHLAVQLRGLDGRDGAAVERVSTTTIGPSARVFIGPESSHDAGQIGARWAGLVGRDPDVTIEPEPRAVWDELGWTERTVGRHHIYEGPFVIHRASGATRTFAGRIVDGDGQIVVFVADPPPEIKRHPKGPCFQLERAPWFRVHWHRPARNVDDGLVYVRRILKEVLP